MWREARMIVLLLVVVEIAQGSSVNPGDGSNLRNVDHHTFDYGFPRPIGSVDAAYDLMDRILGVPEAKESFRFVITPPSGGDPSGDDGTGRPQRWFRLEQIPVGSKRDESERRNHIGTIANSKSSDIQIVITGTSMSELTAGLGFYFKEYCNFTLEWSTGGRAGGSHIEMPPMDEWPVPLSLAAGDNQRLVVVHRDRTVPWSYLMNVCTHSYSLVWYDWQAWESLIDNLALRGINMILALTGQEEVQYKVFRRLGLHDKAIRSWFNGPAFLTWSRGQNEYGSGIGGPLPRSFMQAQWRLQREHILPRLRDLGIAGQLPAFQGNVPIQLKTLYHDANITEQDGTGWMDSLDPLYGTIADMWMVELINDFGTDHYYQIDGYFNGGTAPWFRNDNDCDRPSGGNDIEALESDPSTKQRRDLSNQYRGIASSKAVSDDTVQPHDDTWYRRGHAVYGGLSRTDPMAHWMYQGFSFVGWDTIEQASFLKGFVDSAPPGRFIVIDMGYSSDGEWQKWNNASFFGAPFIWSKLHNFGDTTGMRGNLHQLNSEFPYQAVQANSSIVGIGSTPEGIDQNPIYYEFLYEQGFRQQPLANLTSHIIHMNYKRYGLTDDDDVKTEVSRAWGYLLDSSYSQDFSVQDQTGVAHLNPRSGSSLFEDDRINPKPILCGIFKAWTHFVEAADKIQARTKRVTEPFLFDLVNTGREVLAQLTTPMALNFSYALRGMMNRAELTRTGGIYIDLLVDLARLVETNDAFQLNPWLESARRLAEEAGAGTQFDCFSPILSNSTAQSDGDCRRFYEWNAKCQITTWNPTSFTADRVPGGPVDYAAKHWSGLISEYYVGRARLLLFQALRDQQNGAPLNDTVVQRRFARHAFQWSTTTTSSERSDLSPRCRLESLRVALAVSKEMLDKYSFWFESCGQRDRLLDL